MKQQLSGFIRRPRDGSSRRQEHRLQYLVLMVHQLDQMHSTGPMGFREPVFCGSFVGICPAHDGLCSLVRQSKFPSQSASYCFIEA